jgi:tetratricopeptide (TPR) repeat protein
MDDRPGSSLRTEEGMKSRGRHHKEEFSVSARGRKREPSSDSTSQSVTLPATAISRASRPPLSRRRKWLFRLTTAVVSPVLFLVLLEAGLRLGGYGFPTTFFVGPDADGVYRPNPQFAQRFMPGAISGKPTPCFVSAKPAGTIRVFVLGSSAAQGIPNPSFSFGRILEVMLRERYSGVKFEVVNAALAGINAHVVLEIARDCASHQPDLFVVYMGNNEVIGPYGPGSFSQGWSPSLKLIRASIWVKSTRVGQLLGDAIRCFRPEKATSAQQLGMEMFLDNQVSADDPRLEAVYGNYRQNLTGLCEVGRRAGAAVILSTVAVNLGDCPPFASLHRPDLTDDELAKWKSHYEAGAKFEAKKQWRKAIARYEAAAAIDDRFAELSFRQGRCHAALGRYAEARERFIAARDLDTLRFRADSRIGGIVREVMAARKAAGVCGVDAEEAFAKSKLASGGIAGEGLFYEHVHLTFDGNYLLARSVMEQIERALPQLASSRKGDAVLSRRECAELLALTPWDEHQMALQIFEMTSRPPFTNQIDHSLRQASSRKRVEELEKQALAPRAIAAALKCCEAALKRTPDDGDLHHRYGLLAMARGRPEIAADHFQIALEKLPLEAEVHVHLGQALRDCGQPQEAILQFQKALEVDPLDAQAHSNLASVLHSLGRIDEAVPHYEKALEINPLDSQAHNNLGAILVNRGQIDEAIVHFQKAVEISPDFAKARTNLDNYLRARGRGAGRQATE